MNSSQYIKLETMIILLALNTILVHTISTSPKLLQDFLNTLWTGGINAGIFSNQFIHVLLYFLTIFIIPLLMTIIVAGTTRSLVLTASFIILELYSLKQVIGDLYGYGSILLLLSIFPPLTLGFAVFVGYQFLSRREFNDRIYLELVKSSFKRIRIRLGKILTNVLLSNLALLFSISGISMYFLYFTGMYKDLYFTLHPGAEVSQAFHQFLYGILLSLIISILITVLSKESLIPVLTGIAIALPWISLPIYPLLFLSALIVGERTITKEKGVLLGMAKAVLVYDKIYNPYYEIDQKPILESFKKGKKTWYWKKIEKPIVIDLDKLKNRHVSIFGASGTGKSSLAKNLAIQIYKKYEIPFLIIDHHNEYIDLLEYLGKDVNLLEADKASINPLDLEGRSPRERAIELADIIQSIYGLGYIQRNALEEVILKTYEAHGIFDDNSSTWDKPAPTFYDVYQVLNELLEGEISDQYRLTLERLRAYLRMLLSNIFMETKIGLQTLLTKPTVVLLASLPSDHARALYVDTLMYKLINAMYTFRKREATIVIDEAHLLFKRSRSKALISRLLMESRKYGIGMIIISQQPLDLNESVILNTSIKIVFNIGEYRNLDYISKSLAGYLHSQKINVLKIAISSLPKHHAIANIENKTYLIDTSILLNAA
ncbi:MAG: hypothetical protein DRO40_02270 [Thermoprotei archaeon]|nr:MAG: hypothetical protein DRO40_02270 [Thermoprotei archaeon]